MTLHPKSESLPNFGQGYFGHANLVLSIASIMMTKMFSRMREACRSA